METIMSKTNERAETSHELLDHELDMVTGGSISSIIGHIVATIGTVAAPVAIDWMCPEAN
jgi:hypothetical protein